MINLIIPLYISKCLIKVLHFQLELPITISRLIVFIPITISIIVIANYITIKIDFQKVHPREKGEENKGNKEKEKK